MSIEIAIRINLIEDFIDNFIKQNSFVLPFGTFSTKSLNKNYKVEIFNFNENLWGISTQRRWGNFVILSLLYLSNKSYKLEILGGGGGGGGGGSGGNQRVTEGQMHFEDERTRMES